jgi:hypothetical protein
LLAEFEPAKTVSTLLKTDGRTAFVPISRRGEALSESEPCPFLAEEVGEPSDFFVKKPAAKRLARGLISNDVVGGAGIGDEPGSEAAGAEMGAEKVGGGASIEELVGVDPTWSGVLWKSARVPFSLSSRQRTPRLVFWGDDGFFFTGENWMPFLTVTVFLRRGEPLIGVPVRCGASANEGMGSDLIGDGPITFTGFLLFGVPL